MGTELALYWSLLSVYTSSVMSAYFLPLRGELGAGDGGRLWPSMSSGIAAFPAALAFLELSPAIVIILCPRCGLGESRVAGVHEFRASR
jgi:hypothetical protein